MKALACRDFAIVCDHVTKGDTSHEVIAQALEHVKHHHAKSWSTMENMTKADIENSLFLKIKEIA